MLGTRSQYDKTPFVQVSGDDSLCTAGWEAIASRIGGVIRPGRYVLCVECYPGAFVGEIARAFSHRLKPRLLIDTSGCFREPKELDRMLAPFLTDDPVFGRMNDVQIEDFLSPEKLREARRSIDSAEAGLAIVAGPGAALVAPRWDLLVYANMARWEIQRRQRRNEIGNLGVPNAADSPAAKYKRSFFVDWRAADALKRRLYDRIDFLLDTNDRDTPKLISGGEFRRGLELTVQRPFRVVPFFDPGPWGGQWMKEKFDLPGGTPNYAWCFDCVPEENSLLLGFGKHRVETPAIDIVFRHPKELLGEDVFARFGAEFPIRFDFLDTMEGGNLSLQVHPLAAYIRERFGMSYTQDESYYLLACGEDARVYLGLKEGVDRRRFASDLKQAHDGGQPFEVERHVNEWAARKHDHFLIPAGTVHCSGRNAMVLEISATPFIFTFKLWDWGRLGLNGEPRPIHVEHGLNNIQWNRTTKWVREQLINRVERIAEGAGWREERTGLHELEFIETRRHWFTGPVPHDTGGTVNVVNLVEGGEAVVESPAGTFEPFHVHYAETFIVPASVGPYVIRPARTPASPLATIKAHVRP